MAKDLFAERGIKVDMPPDENSSGPVDLFTQKGISPQQVTTSDSETSPVADRPKLSPQQQAYLTGSNRTPVDTIRDLFAGSLYGLGKGGQFIGNAMMSLPGAQSFANNIQRSTGISVPEVNMQQMTQGYGSPNPSIGGTAAQGIGAYLPFGVAGGASLLGMLAAGGTAGAALTPDNEQNLFGYLPKGKTGGAIEGALLNALTYGAGRVFNSMLPKNIAPEGNALNFSPQVNYSAKPSEFTRAKFNVPEFTKPTDAGNTSTQIAANFAQKLSGGYGLEDAGQEVAARINNHYEGLKSLFQDRYNRIFNAPTGKENYFTGEPFTVKETRLDNSNYKNEYGDQDIPDSNVASLHNTFVSNPTIANAHALQSELGSEIGYLKKQKTNGNLDSNGKNLLSTYATMRETLKKDMNEGLNEINPRLAEDYTDVTKGWNKEIIPYHSDKDLKDIAQGNLKNPGTSKLLGIFKNPEGPIDKVVADLGAPLKDRISYLGLGKTPNELTPDILSDAKNSLDKQGLLSYWSSPTHPENDALHARLQRAMEHENIINQNNLMNEKFRTQLTKAQNKTHNALQKSILQRERAKTFAAKESIKKLKEYQKQITPAAEVPPENSLLREGIGAVGGYLLSKMAGVSPTMEMIDSIIGSRMANKFLKRSPKAPAKNDILKNPWE